MMALEYTREQLKLMISNADRLGFYNDVVHWENELSKLDTDDNGAR